MPKKWAISWTTVCRITRFSSSSPVAWRWIVRRKRVIRSGTTPAWRPRCWRGCGRPDRPRARAGPVFAAAFGRHGSRELRRPSRFPELAPLRRPRCARRARELRRRGYRREALPGRAGRVRPLHDDRHVRVRLPSSPRRVRLPGVHRRRGRPVRDPERPGLRRPPRPGEGVPPAPGAGDRPGPAPLLRRPSRLGARLLVRAGGGDAGGGGRAHAHPDDPLRARQPGLRGGTQGATAGWRDAGPVRLHVRGLQLHRIPRRGPGGGEPAPDPARRGQRAPRLAAALLHGAHPEVGRHPRAAGGGLRHGAAGVGSDRRHCACTLSTAGRARSATSDESRSHRSKLARALAVIAPIPA
jgi:hypothetical protein